MPISLYPGVHVAAANLRGVRVPVGVLVKIMPGDSATAIVYITHDGGVLWNNKTPLVAEDVGLLKTARMSLLIPDTHGCGMLTRSLGNVSMSLTQQEALGALLESASPVGGTLLNIQEKLGESHDDFIDDVTELLLRLRDEKRAEKPATREFAEVGYELKFEAGVVSIIMDHAVQARLHEPSPLDVARTVLDFQLMGET